MRGWSLERFTTGEVGWPGLGVGVAGIVVVTAVIGVLKSLVPVLSLGVLYVFAALPVAILSGTLAAVAIAIASMLAFNFFFLPPLYTFTLADPATGSRCWCS